MNFYNLYITVTCLFICFTLLANNESKDVYFDNEYTYISIDRDLGVLEIYQYDDSSHPIIGDTIRRGVFTLKHIDNNFHSILENGYDEKQLNSIPITTRETGDDNLIIKLETQNLNNDYKLLIYSKRQLEISQFSYHKSLTIELYPDSCGYEFAIVPTSNAFNLLPCFIYGFNNNVKFFKIPQFDNNLFTKGHEIIINIPFLDDSYFQKWIVGNETIKIDKNKIFWNGHVFLPYNCIKKY